MIYSHNKLRVNRGYVPAQAAVLPIAICLAVLIALIRPVRAQTPPPAGGQTAQSDGAGQTGSGATAIEDKMVTVDAENERLADVLPDLMKSVGADYSLDGGIKNARVTIHITKAKFKPTLDAMMKVCDLAVTYRVETGLYHFMALADAPAAPRAQASGRSEAPTRPGPRYNGGDVVSVALSELFQFLSGCEPAFSGRSPFPNNGSLKAGSGSLSGSRSYSEYGFLNGKLTSSGFQTPDTGNPQSSTSSGGYGYFGPFGSGNAVIK